MDSQNHLNSGGYRAAKPIPRQLSEHCGVYFEERLYYHALSLLLNLLSSDAVGTGAVYVPSPQHLAVAATFAVHPYMTTRAKSSELQQVANEALQLLRVVNRLVGPIEARFDAAFAFTHFAISRHGGRRLMESNSRGASSVVKDDSKPLNFELAQAGSLWSRAEDFWQVVGWAFNCSVLHQKRWERWRLWLEFICEVLEDDWKERRRQVEESHGEGTESALPALRETLKESLLLKYINTTSGVSGRYRRIMRAIFADGSSSALNEFREVFHNETRELNQDQDRPQKRQVDVNIDEDEYGDYIGQDNEDDPCEEDPVPTDKERPSRPKRLRRTITRLNSDRSTFESEDQLSALSKPHADKETHMDDLQALNLRKRLLNLLSDASHTLPNYFMTLEEMYSLLAEFIRHLPLPVFQLFVSPSVLPGFAAATKTTLCEALLSRLSSTTVVESDEEYLSQAKLVEYFLPYAATTSNIIDNAKVSILLESLMRLLKAEGELQPSETLKGAVDAGVLARADKSQSDTKKSHAKRREEEIGWTWLIESGDRINYLTNKLMRRADPPAEEDVGPSSSAIQIQNCI